MRDFIYEWLGIKEYLQNDILMVLNTKNIKSIFSFKNYIKNYAK